MLYLFGFVFWWIRDALLPALAVGGVAGGAWLALSLLVWRGRTTLRWRGLAVVAAAMLAVLVTGTRAVWFRFHNPQFAMFRDYVAEPIPDGVQDLVVDSPAPSMFYQGALVRFRAPAAVRDAILAHTLPGAATRLVAQRVADRCERDPTVVARIASPDGGYVRYDPVAFAAFDTAEWAFALGSLKADTERRELRPAPTDHDVFVYAERGDWGSLVCVATIDRGSDRMKLNVRETAAGRRRP